MSSVPTSRVLQALRARGLLRSLHGEMPASLAGITDDSRQVTSGCAFVAIPGTEADGHSFLAAARAAGAAMAIVERDAGLDMPLALVADARRAAAAAAAAFYGDPSRRLRLVGVTGTNGKTTTVSLAHAVLNKTVGRAASIGTVGVRLGENNALSAGGLTTPGPIELQRVLGELAADGVQCVAMEVSSHSLVQRRVDGLEFEVAVFTTFTRDHLDFHGTMDDYFRAKALLAQMVAPNGTVVVNADDPAWAELAPDRTMLTFGLAATAHVRATGVTLMARGSDWTLEIGGERDPVSLPLIGAVNISNALAAASIAHAMGATTADIARALGAVPQVPGRLEVISDSPLTLRDYAHTPDALERALAEMRRLGDGRVIVVFGCGGDRDRGKRPIMGAIAAREAEVAIVTSDNPRSEDPERIIDEIVAGMPRASYERIEDRRDAIERALTMARPGDVVLIAGKGHETYQIRGSTRYPFDEKEIVTALTARSVATASR